MVRERRNMGEYQSVVVEVLESAGRGVMRGGGKEEVRRAEGKA